MSDPRFRDNPWSAEFWNLTQQGMYVRAHGIELARTKAKQAGAVFGAARPTPPIIGPYQPIPARNFTVIIQQKGGRGSGSTSIIGAGSSGNGPPD